MPMKQPNIINIYTIKSKVSTYTFLLFPIHRIHQQKALTSSIPLSKPNNIKRFRKHNHTLRLQLNQGSFHQPNHQHTSHSTFNNHKSINCRNPIQNSTHINKNKKKLNPPTFHAQISNQTISTTTVSHTTSQIDNN